MFFIKKATSISILVGKNCFALLLKICFGFLIHFLLIWRNSSEFKDSFLDSGKHKPWHSEELRTSVPGDSDKSLSLLSGNCKGRQRKGKG